MTDPRICQAQVEEVRRAVQRLIKPRYRLVSSTSLYYHFVNSRSAGFAREYYTVPRSEFWGRSR